MVLAQVAREQGFDNVGLLFTDEPWGRGLAGALEGAWDGALKAIPIERGQTSFLAELRESASGGAQALVVIAFETAALTMVREAFDNGLYDRFVFGDAAKRASLVRTIGGTRLGNMYGTGPATAPESASSAAWDARPMSASTARCRSLPMSRRPTTPRSPWRLRRRPPAGWMAPPSGTGYGQSAAGRGRW